MNRLVPRPIRVLKSCTSIAAADKSALARRYIYSRAGVRSQPCNVAHKQVLHAGMKNTLNIKVPRALRRTYTQEAPHDASILTKLGASEGLPTGYIGIPLNDTIEKVSEKSGDSIVGSNQGKEGGAENSAKSDTDKPPMDKLKARNSILNFFKKKSAEGGPAMDFFKGLEASRLEKVNEIRNQEKDAYGMPKEAFDGEAYENRNKEVDAMMFGKNAYTHSSYADDMAQVDLLLDDRQIPRAIKIFDEAVEKYSVEKGIYDRFLYIYGDKGNFVKAQALLKKMEEKGVHPDLESYMALVEAASQYTDKHSTTLLHETMDMIAAKGWRVEDSLADLHQRIGEHRLGGILDRITMERGELNISSQLERMEGVNEEIRKRLDNRKSVAEAYNNPVVSVRPYSKIKNQPDPKMEAMVKNLEVLEEYENHSASEIQWQLENKGRELENEFMYESRLAKVHAGEVTKVSELRHIMSEWRKIVKHRIEQHIATIDASEGKAKKMHVEIQPFLKCVEPESLALIAVAQTLSLTLREDEGERFTNLVMEIGSRVFDQYQQDRRLSQVRLTDEVKAALKPKELQEATMHNVDVKLPASTIELPKEGLETQVPDVATVVTDGARAEKAQKENNAKYNGNKTVIRIAQLQNEAKKLWDQYQHNEQPHKLRIFWNKVARTHPALGFEKMVIPEWKAKVKARVGAFLVEQVLDASYINSTEPLHKIRAEKIIAGDIPKHSNTAFHHYLAQTGKKKIGMINLHEKLRETLNENNIRMDSINTTQLPMVSSPKPWLKANRGGYFTNRKSLMRTTGGEHNVQANLVEEHEKDLHRVFDALNVLGATPWRINHRVLEVITHIWNEGGNNDLSVPPLASVPLPTPPADKDDVTAQMVYKRAKKEAIKQNRELHSLRCDAQYKLVIAAKLRNYRFFFPHNIDFRGRAYPIPPHLNHLGNDFCRGMLMFGEHKKLGKEGLYWLKVQLANVFGQDKLDLDGRIRFVDDHMDMIKDSAQDPINGKKWWKDAADPFQCLAACIDLTDAYKLDDPTEHLSYLPVHQDGSCNGLQHYAALGGDVTGAYQVNVLPSKDAKPQDVYEACAKIVRELIHSDAQKALAALEGTDFLQVSDIPEADPKHPQHDPNLTREDQDLLHKIMSNDKKNPLSHEQKMALMVEGKITRKVVKQTVMTNVYGVTFVGAREQIAGRFQDRKDIPEEYVYPAAAYVTRKVFDSMGSMFTGARAIQDWLAENARVIASCGKFVHWKTPLGLPVVQVYASDKSESSQTGVQNIMLKTDVGPKSKVNVQRQKSAFPPNFVHSLDATHMLITATMCSKKNILFASVHDSYWTHAGSVEDMNILIRDAFVELHRQPILDQLLQFWKAHYGGLNMIQGARAKKVKLLPLPKRGIIDLEKVKNSPYFFD